MYSLALGVVAIVAAYSIRHILTPVDYCYGTGKATGGSLIASSLPPSLTLTSNAFKLRWENSKIVITHSDNEDVLWSTLPGLPFVSG